MNFIKYLAIELDSSPLPNNDITDGSSVFTNALGIVFGVAGAVALLMVTYSGFKYVLSQGNPQETAKAKDSLINAVIGLVVALFAFVIVQFVVGNV